jgi:dTDP-4-amino-4,6-dideoxygalactose transaminase
VNAKEPIPFLDLVTPHRELKEELCSVFANALDKGAFVGGAMVEGFEKDFAAFCDAEYCVGVANGTDAVRFALMAAGVRRDTVVVTVPNTFIATSEAISQAGASPVFVDVDERTYNMDPVRLREYLERDCFVEPASGELIDRRLMKPVSAVVPVHLYGQMADMDEILKLADAYRLIVVEDACQAHGAQYYSRTEERWRTAGSMGKAAGFSFYPGKNLGACGEGGAVTTNDPEVARKIRMLREHGQAKKYYHEFEGYNGRLDAIQAGLLQVKLRQLPGWNQQRREAATRYRTLLDKAGLGWLTTPEPEWSRSVYHLFVARVRDREGLMKHLTAENVGTGIHYPVPLHLQNAYTSLGYKRGDFPVTEAAAPEIVSLPMFPGLSAQQQERVVDSVARFLFSPEAVGGAQVTYAAAGD